MALIPIVSQILTDIFDKNVIGARQARSPPPSLLPDGRMSGRSPGGIKPWPLIYRYHANT